jgi:hypothetical protein
VATFFTDLEASGGGEFLDTAEVGIRYTLPAGTINYLRVYWPAVAPSGTPVMRLWDSGGTLLQTISFDTTTLSAWNNATPGSPIAVSAGTYYVSWGTTRYKAISGFFSGGSITRGSITAVEGRFATVGSFPSGTSAAGYVADLDFTPTGGGGAAPSGLAVPVTLGSPVVDLNRSAAPAGLAVAVALGQAGTNVPGAITTRPYAGITTRPYSGITPRP